MEKVGRNDPCPCGSGKKYKKCHGTGGQKTAATSTAASGAPEEEPLEGYALTPSQQKRWLDRSVLRTHNRILEMSEDALFEMDWNRLGDFEKWALAQRLRELGDQDSFERLRISLAQSDSPDDAINYVDILESAIAESLRSRAQHEDAQKAAERLAEVSKDPPRQSRSRALVAALQIESGSLAADLGGTSGPHADLVSDGAPDIHRDDFAQAALRRGDYQAAEKWLEAKPQHSLLAEQFSQDLAEIKRRSELAHGSGTESVDLVLQELEKAESAWVKGESAGFSSCRDALKKALESGEKLPQSTGRRVLDLVRFKEPIERCQETPAIGEPGRRAYRDISDAAIRWLLESRHRDHFSRTMMEVLGDFADTSRTEILELFVGYLVCDAPLPDSHTCLSTFSRERSLARNARWEDVMLAMETSATDLYEVADADEDGNATLRNIGDNSTHRVPAWSLPIDAGLGDGLLSRLITTPSGLISGHAAAIPRALIETVKEFTESAIQHAREQSADLSRARALKLSGAEVLVKLRDLQDEWRTQGLEYPRTRGSVRERLALCQAQVSVSDVKRTQRLLDEAPWIESLENNRWRIQEHALEASSPAGPRTLSHVELDEQGLVIHATTRQVMSRMAEAIQRLLGSGAHLTSITTSHE